MARKSEIQVSDSEISEYDNVPFQLAARYLGTSDIIIRRALQQGRAPFGFAAESPSGTWAYNISPQGLINYKRGGMRFFSLQELVDTISDAVTAEIDTRLAAAKDAVNNILGGN